MIILQGSKWKEIEWETYVYVSAHKNFQVWLLTVTKKNSRHPAILKTLYVCLRAVVEATIEAAVGSQLAERTNMKSFKYTSFLINRIHILGFWEAIYTKCIVEFGAMLNVKN